MVTPRRVLRPRAGGRVIRIKRQPAGGHTNAIFREPTPHDTDTRSLPPTSDERSLLQEAESGNGPTSLSAPPPSLVSAQRGPPQQATENNPAVPPAINWLGMTLLFLLALPLAFSCVYRICLGSLSAYNTIRLLYDSSHATADPVTARGLPGSSPVVHGIDLSLIPLQVHQPLLELASLLYEPLPYPEETYDRYPHTVIDTLMDPCKCPLRWDWKDRRFDESAVLFNQDMWEDHSNDPDYQAEMQWLMKIGLPGLQKAEWDNLAARCFALEDLTTRYFKRDTRPGYGLWHFMMKKHGHDDKKNKNAQWYRNELVTEAAHGLGYVIEHLLHGVSAATARYHSHRPMTVSQATITWDLVKVYLTGLDALTCNVKHGSNLTRPHPDRRFKSNEYAQFKREEEADAIAEENRLFEANPRDPDALAMRKARMVAKHMARYPRASISDNSDRSPDSDIPFDYRVSFFGSVIGVIRRLEDDAQRLRHIMNESRAIASKLVDHCDLHNYDLQKYWLVSRKALCAPKCLPRGWPAFLDTMDHSGCYDGKWAFMWEGYSYGFPYPKVFSAVEKTVTALEARAAQLGALLTKIDKYRRILRAAAELYADRPAGWFAPAKYRKSFEEAGHYLHSGVIFEGHDFLCNSLEGVDATHLSSAPLCPDANSPEAEIWTEAKLWEEIWALHGVNLSHFDDPRQILTETFSDQVGLWQRLLPYWKRVRDNGIDFALPSRLFRQFSEDDQNATIPLTITDGGDGAKSPVDSSDDTLLHRRICDADAWLQAVKHEAAVNNNTLAMAQRFTSSSTSIWGNIIRGNVDSNTIFTILTLGLWPFSPRPPLRLAEASTQLLSLLNSLQLSRETIDKQLAPTSRFSNYRYWYPGKTSLAGSMAECNLFFAWRDGEWKRKFPLWVFERDVMDCSEREAECKWKDEKN